MVATKLDDQAVFEVARKIGVQSARQDYLLEVCGDDPAMRRRIEALLRAYDNGGSFLECPPLEVRTPTTIILPAPVLPGVQIGPYKLLQKIGEGGMGSVWMVEQTEPVKRRVALKLIRVDRGDSKMILSRFEAERQAIALMDHPNIARLLDAGSTEAGQPFFVMELVKGVPLTEFCDAHKLRVAERLDLFVQICSAVQHAHQKGIIHRDLKPTNILVETHDGKPVPKVIDFGLAKATSGISLTDHTLFTTFGNVMGTPMYMAPEQASFDAVDVDTRADVYSLGVILFELLTGTTPISGDTVKTAPLDELLKLVREEEPPKPSTRLSLADTMPGIAANRGIEPARLSKLLRGDLDWIVLKALEKDRARRYETANGFAADIRRYLSNEPVSARPPSSSYRLQKLIRRNKLTFAAGGAIAMSLLIGITVSLWQTMQAERAKSQVVNVLNELKAAAPAFAEQARGLVAKEQFNEALERLAYASKLRPDVPEYFVAQGDVLQCQFRFAKASEAYRAALALRPSDARAKANAALCDELLAAHSGDGGKLTLESLSKLHQAMQEQQRPVAQLMPVARLLGLEQMHVAEYWRARFRDLPIAAGKSLKRCLYVGPDGRLHFDLSGSRVTDLSPLAGAPLSHLDLSGIKDLTDLSALRGMGLTRLLINGTSVADLSPLREMRTLENFRAAWTQVFDLSPLEGLALKSLDLSGSPVSDLSPLSGAPLQELTLRGTHVTDLSPLSGMPLKRLDLHYTPVIDFKPLAGLPLEKCNLQYNRITDLTVLRGMPLRELVLWGCRDARNFHVLSEIKTLEVLLLPSEYRELPEADFKAIAALREHPRLRQLGSEVMDNMDAASTGSKAEFWRDWDTEQTFLPSLRQRELKFGLFKLTDGTYQLNFRKQPLSDLSILRGAPISELKIHSCDVTNLEPLKDLRLRVLILDGNPVEDLSPLRGMPLEELDLGKTNIADLSPLTQLPLKKLYLQSCPRLTDLSALAEIATLEKVTVPTAARNVELLRTLPKLQMLAFELTEKTPFFPVSTAEEFWKDLAANPWLKQLRDSGFSIKVLRRLPDRTWSINLENSAIADLTFLKGAPISRLWLGNTAVSDLTPLRDMPLRELRIYNTRVTDLSPLQGMPIDYLHLSGTNVTDISPLRDMPLTRLRMHACTEAVDVTPLAGNATLKDATLPPLATNVESLRDLPNIERLSFIEDAAYLPDKNAAEFWKDFDSQKPDTK